MASRPRLPPPVRPGDRIGVAALSGPVDPARLADGLDALHDLGFEPVPAANLGRCEPLGLFAGDDGERLRAFHDLADDPTIAAIVFARGGHGVLRLLPQIDWPRLARHPRAYVGYSDLTPFLLQVVERLGWIAFHGPMIAADFARGLTDAECSSFLDTLGGRFPQELPLAGTRAGTDAEGSQAGAPIEGALLGGCLSMLAATLGTPWAPDLAGAVLFWEDVAEPLYRLDRQLTQCVLSNRLDDIRAMVVGHADPADGTVDELHAWLQSGPAADLGCPIGWGLETGHRAPNRTLPLGGRARLEPEGSRLILLPDPA